MRRIDVALSNARVSASLKEILAQVSLERGWLYRPEETYGQVQHLVQRVEKIPSEPEQIEFLLEDERAPKQKFDITPAQLPEEFSKSNDGHKYEAYNWRPSLEVYYTEVVVFRDGKPWHGDFSFLSMKRFDRILGIGNSGFGANLSADVTLDRGQVVRLLRKGFKGETTQEVVPESALEGARTEPVSYFVVQGSTEKFGHLANIAGVPDNEGCFRFAFEWRWNETREIYPGIGQVLVGGIETNKGAAGYVDLDQRRTVVFPRQLTVDGIGVLWLRRLRGPGNQVAEYNGTGTPAYELSLEQGEGSSAPHGRLRRK